MDQGGARTGSLPLRDIERPLGLGLAPVADHPIHRRRRLSPSSVLATLTAVAVVAGSSAIAFRERPFRMPVQTVVSVPELVPEAAPVAAEAPPADTVTATSPAGPSIIRVQPGTAGAPGSVVTIRDPAAVGQDGRVAHLPDRVLLEDSPHGPLPIRAADGRRPFDVYARPWSGARGARVALVIGGLGVSQTGTQGAIATLPPEVTLAFASGGNSLQRWMQAARQAGHEIVMQVPLEPFDYPQVDPGRATLLTEASSADNLDSLHWTLARTTNYVGVMNYMGARFTAETSAMEPFMEELGKRGLLYLDDGSSARSQAEPLAKAKGVPFAAATMVIDGTRERGEVLKKLDELERTARAQGSAIGTGSAFDITVDAVAQWVAEARRRGIEIVPVSALAHDPERR